MGMFDEIRCKYKLPIEVGREVFQTKDTPGQYLDMYEIREDGTLWREDYDLEDRSDPGAECLLAFAGCATRTNKRWVSVPLTGEVRFYGFPTGDSHDGGWVEFSAYFVDGKLRELHTITNCPPVRTTAASTRP